MSKSVMVFLFYILSSSELLLTILHIIRLDKNQYRVITLIVCIILSTAAVIIIIDYRITIEVLPIVHSNMIYNLFDTILIIIPALAIGLSVLYRLLKLKLKLVLLEIIAVGRGAGYGVCVILCLLNNDTIDYISLGIIIILHSLSIIGLFRVNDSYTKHHSYDDTILLSYDHRQEFDKIRYSQLRQNPY